MKIAPKLGLGFGAILALMVVMGGVSLLQLSKLNGSAAEGTTQATAAYSSARYWVVGILLGAVVLGSLVAFTLARSLASAATRMLEMI